LIQRRRSFLDSSIACDTWGLERYNNFEINPWLHLTSDLPLVQNDDMGFLESEASIRDRSGTIRDKRST
jgi:hypothetical protein